MLAPLSYPDSHLDRGAAKHPLNECGKEGTRGDGQSLDTCKLGVGLTPRCARSSFSAIAPDARAAGL